MPDRRYQAAMTRLGVPSLDAFVDPNSPTCFGIYQRRCLNATGRRSSTYHAFLPKSIVRQRSNLTICLGANVQQIQFSHDNDLRATGLLIEGANRKFYTVRAKHEIILCAGAIVTPQLLLLRHPLCRTYLMIVASVLRSIFQLFISHVSMISLESGRLSYPLPLSL